MSKMKVLEDLIRRELESYFKSKNIKYKRLLAEKNIGI